MPPGFVAIRDGALPDGLPTVSFNTWEAEAGHRFTVNVSEILVIGPASEPKPTKDTTKFPKTSFGDFGLAFVDFGGHSREHGRLEE